MQTCLICGEEKEVSEFRGKTDKRIKDPVKRVFFSKTCKKCEAAKQKERVKKQRSTPEGKERHNKWANEFHSRHREKCLAKMKERRQTPEYKAYMKAYREKNKEKIKEQELITKRKYHEKNKKEITDKYASHILRTQGKDISEENLELEKVKILVHRIKKVILNTEVLDEIKVCSRCLKEKKLSDFYRNRTGGNGRLSKCRECCSEIAKQKREKINNNK